MAGASEVGICNSALIKLGVGKDGRISGLGQDTKNATACNEQYEKLRDAAIRRHKWNFSIARAKLALSTTSPVFGPENAFQLPSDWIRTVSVHDNDVGVGLVRYKIEGNKILSDSTDIWLRYARRIEDPNEMTVDFREVLATMIAKDIALVITQSNTVKKDMKDDLRKAISAARSVDALEDWPEQSPPGSWTQIRNGRGSRNRNEFF